MPGVIAFDLFGTVFDMSRVPREEVRAYAAHIRRPDWSPLRLPAEWDRLPPHPDAAEGVARLRTRFTVVTLSNAPLGLQTRLLKNGGVAFDGVVPLELARVFKPDPRAYLSVCDVLDVPPAAVHMVSANATFGDIEAARALGMTATLIRCPGGPATILDLATALGC